MIVFIVLLLRIFGVYKIVDMPVWQDRDALPFMGIITLGILIVYVYMLVKIYDLADRAVMNANLWVFLCAIFDITAVIIFLIIRKNKKIVAVDERIRESRYVHAQDEE